MPRASHIALAGGLLLSASAAFGLALLLEADWNRARPWVQQKLGTATGRSVAIQGDLELTWQAPPGASGWRAWIPWPHLQAHQVVLGNAGWSQHPEMARVNRLSFSIDPVAALQKRIVIPALALDAPELLLERTADGRDNWTFGEKEGGWQFAVRRLVVNHGRVVIDDAVRKLRVTAEAVPRPEPTALYALDWRLRGSLGAASLEGGGSSGGQLDLHDETAAFPLAIELRAGSTRIAAGGILRAPAGAPGLDLQLKVSGISMAQLWGLTGIVLPETPPYATDGRLVARRTAEGVHWRYENFSGKVGATDLAGTLAYRSGTPRPTLEGEVASRLLRVADLAPLLGVDSAASRKRRGNRTAQPGDRIFPVEPLRTERWNSIDADVRLSADKATRRHELPVEKLSAHVRLQEGVLTLAPLQFGVAGGTLDAALRLDGRRRPVEGEMTVSARRLKLARLLPKTPEGHAGTGELSVDAALRGSGNSFAGMIGASAGELRAAVNRGSVSKLLLDRMGMNFGSMLVTRMFGDRPVGIQCAVGDFLIEKGVLRPRAFVLDTEEARIHLDGKVDLGAERLGLTLYPESKGVHLVSLRSPLHLTGSFRDPVMEADRGMLALRAGGALALGAFAPLAAALLPLVEVGPGETNECAALMASAAGG
ncbi:MAG TPA: AsmA family protein [Noviherbaspirillum sp.]|jgi:uncharacterized protein involved in outer membrane biogenesis|uniref:AsmA family protein n=1 Tax=Noviherbaspirillum sp. TaxID=1926288 RepID=UPI002F951CD5